MPTKLRDAVVAAARLAARARRAAGPRRPRSGMRAPLASRWTWVGGRRIHARVSAPAPPAPAPSVVLVHGMGVSSRYMIPLAERLAPWHPVSALDLPGFGESDRPPRALPLAGLVDALAAWMDAVHLPRAALLGNSYGCQVITALAARHPHRVDRLVLVGPTIDGGARRPARQVLRLLVDATREPLSLVALVLGDYRDCGPRRLLQTFRDALADRIEERLPRVEAPVLVVRGARDPIVSQRWTEDVTRLLPRGRLVVIPGGAHAVHYSAPLPLLRVLRPFLAGGRAAVAA